MKYKRKFSKIYVCIMKINMNNLNVFFFFKVKQPFLKGYAKYLK